jgi:hypothetical protein
MPLLGFSGAQYPYYHAQYANVGPGAVIGERGAVRTEANRPFPAGSRFDPLLGVVPMMLGGSPSNGWVGDERMGLYGQGNGTPYGRHLGLAYPQFPVAQPSSAAPLLPERDSKARETKASSPKRRRQPSIRAFEQIDVADTTSARPNQGTEKQEALASSASSPVKLTRNHYEMLVEHHANLVNEIQETELMLSVYEQQANPQSSNIPPASRSDDPPRQKDPSTKKRPSPGKREVDAEACSKKKRG